MRPRRRNPALRWLRAGMRDTLVLFRDFRGPLAVFVLTLLGGGWLYQQLASRAGEPVANYPNAVFLVLSMIFLQANADFPRAWYLEAFFFAMPVLGLGTLALGAADFGVLLFNRRTRGEPWEVAIASTCSEHVIMVGLGHLGFRVVRELHALGEDVVVVEADLRAELLAGIKALDIPVIVGDAAKAETLGKAGVARARSIVLCSNDDSLNLRIALKARGMNPKIRTVVRVFDEEFGHSIQALGIDAAFSASAMAAPAVAGAAAHADISRTMTVDGRVLSLGHITIRPRSALARLSVGQIEHDYDVSVVLLRRDGAADLHPHPDVIPLPGDTLAVFAEPTTLSRMVKENR